MENILEISKLNKSYTNFSLTDVSFRHIAGINISSYPLALLNWRNAFSRLYAVDALYSSDCL